jgi:hypothetical protein
MAGFRSRAVPIPDYKTTVFTDDKTNPRAFVEVVLGLVTTVLCWLLVGARFAARYRIHSIGPDDLLILVATVFFTVYAVSFDFIHRAVPGSAPSSFKTEATYQLVSLLNEMEH